MTRKHDAFFQWGASAILTPIFLGALGACWGVYNDVQNLKAAEEAGSARIDRLEKNYREDIVEIKAQVGKVYDILIQDRQFRKTNR